MFEILNRKENMMTDTICFEVRVTRKQRIITYLFNKFFQNLMIANRLQRRKIDKKTFFRSHLVAILKTLIALHCKSASIKGIVDIH